MPRSLEDVLALEYSGNSLRSLLERGPHPRYESDLLIAFRTCLGTEGGRWLGRAVRSLGPEPTVGKVELLSVDLDAARECQNLLLKWANASPIDAVVLWSIRILLEIDCRAPIPTHKMFEALNGESDMVRQHALQQLDLLGTNIDIIAPELLNILATCRNGHMPSWREVGRGASPFEPEGIQERSRPDSCGRVLRALSRGGPAVEDLVSDLIDLLGRPRSDRIGIVRFLGTRQQSRHTVVPVVVDCCSDAEPRVREAAARALGALGVNSDAVQAALAVLQNDPDEWVHQAARASTLALRRG